MGAAMVHYGRARVSRRQIDRNYPFQVEIEVPEGGLGERLNAMHAWCTENAPDYQTKGAGEYPTDAVMFCFGDKVQAAAFRRAFNG